MSNNIQMPLFCDEQESVYNDTGIEKYRVGEFSAGGVADQTCRKALEEKYFPLVEVTDKFSRQNVSFQLGKKCAVSRWLKYKEGFSQEMVEALLDEMGIAKNDTVLDPFMGSGTAAFTCKLHGINSAGYDIMPMSSITVKAKCDALNCTEEGINELRNMADFIASLNRPASYTKATNEVRITQGAYPLDTARDIEFFKECIATSAFSPVTKNFATLSLMNSLERLSYTSKDGQYLRWDVASSKIQQANQARAMKGLPPLEVRLCKGRLPVAKELLLQGIADEIYDIEQILRGYTRNAAAVDFRQGSVLTELPLRERASVDAVITSPPYCNRYDYTRIYALELCFLGLQEQEINAMRQDLLSCTVENRSKRDFLLDYYAKIGRKDDAERVINMIDRCPALVEVMNALDTRLKNGDINNKGVIKMVKGYFDELAFVYFELFRVCKTGAHVAFVNDNVRYAGEVIPVDFISTALAQMCGLVPRKIYTLRQQKGNSSQQMKKFGRIPLRKSITMWAKC